MTSPVYLRYTEFNKDINTLLRTEEREKRKWVAVRDTTFKWEVKS
jgi:hypothetical protein